MQAFSPTQEALFPNFPKPSHPFLAIPKASGMALQAGTALLTATSREKKNKNRQTIILLVSHLCFLCFFPARLQMSGAPAWNSGTSTHFLFLSPEAEGKKNRQNFLLGVNSAAGEELLLHAGAFPWHALSENLLWGNLLHH